MPQVLKSLTPDQKKTCKRLANELTQGVNWRNTPQGQRYWEEVYNNLRALANYDVYPYNEDLGLPGKVLDGTDDDDALIPEPELFDEDEDHDNGH